MARSRTTGRTASSDTRQARPTGDPHAGLVLSHADDVICTPCIGLATGVATGMPATMGPPPPAKGGVATGVGLLLLLARCVLAGSVPRAESACEA
eukprot:3576151-Prymnesium_polylepis.2